MNIKPRIFISGVSSELRNARQLIANVLHYLGYEPVWQDILNTEHGDLRGVLKDKIDSCQAVVQIVGFTYGAEPPIQDPQFGRVSYTQFEALYAKQRDKPVWIILCDEKFPLDTETNESEDKRSLQKNYRESIRSSQNIFHPVGSLEALEASLLKLREDLRKLRKPFLAWAATVSSIGVLILLVTAWIAFQQLGIMSNEEAQSDLLSEQVAVDNLNRAINAMDRSDRGQIEALERLLELGRSYSGAKLKGISLAGLEAPDSDFSGANLKATNLSDAALVDANLSNSTLGFGNLESANLTGANLEGLAAPYLKANRLEASQAQASAISLFGCQLKGADLSGAQLQGASLAFCDLRNVNFESADLTDATLFGSIVDGARFTDATLSNTDLSYTTLSYTDLQYDIPLSENQLDGACAVSNRSRLGGRMIGAMYIRLMELIPDETGYNYEQMSRADWAYLPINFTDRIYDSCVKRETSPSVSGSANYTVTYWSNEEMSINDVIQVNLKQEFLESGNNRQIVRSRVQNHNEFIREAHNQKRVFWLNGKACNGEPNIQQIRALGADGRSYQVIERSCSLILSGEEYTPVKNQPIPFEIQPIENNYPRPFNTYRARLLWLKNNASALNNQSSLVNRTLDKIAVEIIREHQTTYEDPAVSIAPHIERSQIDLDNPAENQVDGDLGDELRSYIIESAQDMPDQFVTQVGLGDLDFDIEQGSIRHNDELLLSGEKQPYEGFIDYDIQSGEQDATDLVTDDPITRTNFAHRLFEYSPSKIRMDRILKLPEIDVSPQRARRLRTLVEEGCCAKAYMVFTAGFTDAPPDEQKMTGSLEEIILGFYADNRATDWGDEDALVRIESSRFPQVDKLVRPLSASLFRNVRTQEVQNQNPFRAAQTKLYPFGFVFDREIEFVSNSGAEGIDLRCGNSADLKQVPVALEVRGRVLRIHPKYPLKSVAGELGSCESSINTDVVQAKNNGGRLEEPLSAFFRMGNYRPWDNTENWQSTAPPTVTHQVPELPDDLLSDNYQSLKIHFTSEVEPAQGVDLLKEINITCGDMMIPFEANIVNNDTALEVKPTNNVEIEEGVRCRLEIPAGTLAGADEGPELDHSISGEWDPIP